MTTLARAIRIAAQAHEQQPSKDGQPYILHPIRVMLRMATEEERIVAVLHDLLEDTPWTVEALLKQGFSKPVVRAVACLTKKNREQYDTFIRRVEKNALALKVKIADIEDNMDVRRLDELGEGDLERLKKYHTYHKRLVAKARELRA